MDKKELEKKIDEVFSRGVSEIIDPDGKFRKKLKTNPEKIVIKYGVDPTKPDIHLGHAVCFHKLRQFQDLGCRVIFLIGDFTAQIGDPSGKSVLRPVMEIAKIHENMKTYIDQVKKILNNNTGSVQNSTWYMPFDDVWVHHYKKSLPFFAGNENKELLNDYIEERKKWETRVNAAKQFVTLSNMLFNLRFVTVDQIIERDMFKNRKKNNKPIYMNEFIYPVLQGIDSVVIANWMGSCDLEVGGTDQYFNMLMGRQMMEKDGFESQSVMTIKILEGTDGKEKMSKSLDNYIGITEDSNSMFGKIMSIPDTSIINYYELCTDISINKIKEIEKKINIPKTFWDIILSMAGFKKQEMNPRDAKIMLAEEIVKMYHGENEAQKAKDYFVKTISKKETPDEINEVIVGDKEIKLVEFLVLAKLATSNSDARRKIKQGGVSFGGKKVTDTLMIIDVKNSGSIIKVGKFGFAKIKFK